MGEHLLRENVAFAAIQTWVIACHHLDADTHEMTMCKLI